ncbi:Ig-like domain-containing protein [uncultured Roseibium sp.]|uniref:Ig-like domain-containing protein n=1 Tax=uncultured Roseibium sp. TaxID=1936171 RepID=UPI00261F3735|nr:Ig-like domain-containing protein [uncultured Roseibium sp.]
MVGFVSEEVQVNIYTSGDQDNTHMAALAGGGYVTVWQSASQNGSGDGLVAQLYNDFGERVGLPFFIEEETVGSQTIGGVAGTADGGFVVTWQAQNGITIFARKFDANGQPTGSEFQANTEVYSTQNEPEVTGLTGGGYVVTWASFNDETFTYDIRAQRFDPSGVPQGAEIEVNTTTPSTQASPEIAALNDGGFVIVWRDDSGADGSSSGIFAQRYDASGTPQGTEFQVNSTTAGQQTEQDVVALDGGGFVVVWTDYNGSDGSSGGVYAQIYDASGADVGSEFLVNQTTANWQWEPAVTATPDGGFFVTWYGYGTPNGSTFDIVGRHFDATGTPLTDDIIINDDGTGTDPRRPDVIALANGGIVVGWDYPAANGDGSGRSVYQRFLELDNSNIMAPASPILEAFDTAITFTEAQLQSGPQILDASGAVAVSGPADFDGGRLSVTRITATNDQNQFNMAAGLDDDILGLRDQGTGAGQVGVSGTDVTFGGVLIGTITSDGTNSAPFVVTFNANADRQAVEAVAENLTYENPSDDPAENVQLALLLEDGDGSASDPVTVAVTVIPEDDAPRPIYANDIDVNTFFNSTQQEPAVAALSDGGWVVLWESFSQDTLNGNTYGIFGQRYSANGVPSGNEFIVNTQVLGSQQQVDVAGITGGANAGGFIATWYDQGDPGILYVKAQVFDANSQPVGSEISVPATPFSTQWEPSVATFADGSFAIAWSQFHTFSGQTTFDVTVQRFDASGAKVGSEIVANTFLPSTQGNPEIVALSGGGFALTWETFDQGGTGTYEIATRVYAADGTPVSAEIRVNTSETGAQRWPEIAALDGGGYVIVWTDQSGLDSSGSGVYGQIYDATGTAVGGQFLVNEVTQGTQDQPVVTGLPGGGFAVAFETTASIYDGSYNIIIQHYDASGNRVDGEILVNQDRSGSQYQSTIATLNNGDTVIAWRDDSGRDGSGPGIVMQIVGDPANYTGAQNNPVLSIAQSVVNFDESDVNSAPQHLFASAHVADSDSADFDGGLLSISRTGAIATQTLFNAPDNETQDNLGINNQGTGAGEIGVSGANVTFGGTVIGTIVSDGSNGAALTLNLNSSATPDAVEALLEQVTYSNPSDDPIPGRIFRITLTDGDGGAATPVNVQVLVNEEAEANAIMPLFAESQVNSFEDSTQNAPDVGALASGGYVSVWVSTDQDAGTFDNGIFAQRFDASGQAIGDEFQVNSLTAGNQNDPQVAGIGAADGGGYVVVWQDSTNSSGYIKAQVHNDDGSVRTAEFMVETVVFSTQDQPAVTAVPGGFLVTWSSFNGDSNTWDIRGQYFNGTGVSQGSEFTVNTTVTAGTQRNSDVSVDSAGNVVVVWEDQSAQDGASFGVYGQRIDSSGTLVGPEFLVNTTTNGGQYLPKVDYLSDGRFVVAWYDDTGIDGSGVSVMAQLFAADATPIGSEFLVNEQVSSTQQIRDVVGLSNGGFAIAYDDSSGSDGSGVGVFLQQFNPDGSRLDGPVLINDEITSTQNEVQIVEITDGTDTGIAAVWTSANSAPAGDGSGSGVFTRVLGEAGTLQPANFVPDVENLAVVVDFDVATIGTPQIIDNGLQLSDFDSADFDGGSVELKHLSYRSTTDDQLSVISGKGITTSGSDVLYDGTIIGTIDAIDDGVNGNDFVINLNANANAANVRFLLEQIGYSSTNPVAGSERQVSVRVSDGDGGLSEGDSIRIDIEGSAAAAGIFLTDVDHLQATESEVEAGIRLDPAVDFDYTLVNGFDGGFVDLGYRNAPTSRSGSNFETLSVTNDGTGLNQIGVSGNDISYQGVVIGTVDGTLDGQNGADLRINLVAAATQNAVDALIEAFRYTNNSDGPASIVRFDVRVTDAANATTGDRDFDLSITPETDGTTVALGGEMQVNAFTTSTQYFATLTELSDGGFVVTWESYNQDSSNGFDYGVYQQRYTAAGEPIGPEVLVNQFTNGQQDQADVAGLTGGGWVTVWEGPGSSGQDVHARIFDANGVGGTEFQLNLQTSSSQYNPSVAALANGNFVVTWGSETSAGAGDGSGQGVIGRVFQADGTPISGSDIVLNTFTSSTQSNVDVVGLTGGGFVAVWQSNGVDGNSWGVAFQRFDDVGVPQGSEVVVNTTTTGAQDTPAIASLTDGGFVIVWQAPDASGDGVFMQRYDASGSPVGGEEQVSDYIGSTQGQPDVTGTADGGWLVTWNDGSSRLGGGTDIFAQRYDASGNRVDGSFRVNEEFLSTQDHPAATTLSDGRVVVAWDSNTSGSAGDGSDQGVFIRLYGTAAQTTSDDPYVNGLVDVTLDEATLNAGFTQIFATGSVAIADLDSADLDGGRLMVHIVRDYAAAEQFNAPDDLTQDIMTFAGTGILIAGSSVSVGGVSIGTLEADGQSGNGLQVLLNANATPERVETLLNGLNYRNPSNDPQDTREVEVTLSDGDGGVSEHQTFTISITPELDGFEKVDTEKQVNSFTAGVQDTSDVAGLAGGGHVVVWQSSNQDNPGTNDTGIFGQRYDANGQPVGSEFQVNTTFAGTQNTSSAIGMADGSFVVAWQGVGVGDGSGVFAQRFAADGTPLGSEFRINDSTSSSDTQIELAAGQANGFMAVWYSSTGSEIQGRFYDNAGVAQGTEFTINTNASGTQDQPDVVGLNNGNYAVVWEDSSTSDIVLRIVNGTNSFATSEINLTSSFSGSQLQPNITSLAGGGFVVSWTDTGGRDGSANGTYAQLFTNTGVATTQPFLVNEIVTNSQDNAEIVGTPDGGFVVVFRDTTGVDGSGQGIMAQQFDANGNRVDGQITVNTETSSTQNQPSVDLLADGSVIVSWTSTTSASAGDGSSNGVFSQILGDPANFNLVGRPILQGVNETVTYLENQLNIGPQLLDANNAVALSDSDSADFDGGFIRLDNVISTRGYQNQVSAPDNFTQDNLGLRQDQGITITANNVFVNGTQVGTIVESGVAGDPFEISLNANATIAIVELLVENLTYRNTSDDPDASRVVRVQVGDGDGGVSDPSLVTINVTSEIDGAGPVFGERRANTETINEQSQSDVAYLIDGGFVIVWRSYNQDSVNTYGVYGQRFDANGNAVGTEFLVNTTVASSQYEPSVTGLDTGGWAVTWRDDSGSDGSGSGVFMQRYNDDGTTAGAETQVNTYFSSTQYEPDITVLANGDYVVTWTSFGNTGGGGSGWDVWAQVYQPDGTAIGAEFLVNSENSGTQDQPSVTAFANGGFAITWKSQNSGSAGDGDSNGVFYQVYADSVANYTAVGGELQANSYTDSSQDNPKIVGLVGGGHVIVWESSGQDGSADGVFAQQYDAAGLPIGQEFRVNDQRINTQSQVDIAALSSGGYVIVFADNNGTDGSGWGIFAQQYAANGNRIDGPLQVNTETSSTQDEPSVAALDNGGFVVSWTSVTSASAGDGSSDGVFYQVFSNSAPVVTDINASTAEDTNLVFDAATFEAGYQDAENQALAEIRIDVLPSTGTLEYNNSPVAPGQVVTVAELNAGALVYIPPADFNGSADFGWTGSDGTSFASAIAQTFITVTPVNDPVALAPIGNQTISEGSNLNIQAIIGDPDNDTYAITVNYGEGDPDVNFTTTSKMPSLVNFYQSEGTYTVNLSIDDQNGSVESTSFMVTVDNAAPNADNESFSIDEDTVSNTVNVFVGDSDPGGDPFSITAIDGNAYTPGATIVLASGATVSISATGDLVYDPTTSTSIQSLASGQNTTDSFTYTITDDGGLSDTATVTAFISGADDNVNAQDDDFTVDEDSTLAGNVFSDNGNGADIDPEGDALTVVSINGNNGLVGAPIVVAGGGVLQVDANGDLSFDTANTYNELNVGDTRDISFTYVVEEAGSNLTASATGTITITGVNDDPTANDDTRSTQLNTPVNIDVASNDFDVDNGDTFTVTAVSTPSNGTAVIELDGTVTYTPNNGYSGPDSFTYDITDANGGMATATVNITVQGSNAPVAQNDSVTTDEATLLSGSVFLDNGNGADFDPEGDPFSVTAVNGLMASVGSQITLVSGALLTLNANGTFDYDPNGSFESLAVGGSTTDTFSYTITDSNNGSDTGVVTVTVTGLNDDPTVANGAMNAVEDGAPVNLNLATLGDDVDSDDDGSTLGYAITTQPGEGSASITGTNLNFDPGADFQDLNEGETRDVTIGVTATDSNAASSNEGTVTVSVLGVNDDPTLGAGILNAVEDGPAVMLDLSTLGDDADSEDDGTTLTYSVAGQPAEGSASVLGTTLTFDPGADFQDLNAGETRDVTVTVEAEDQRGATVQNDVTVTVTGVNDDPTLGAGVLNAAEDGPAVMLDLSTLGDDADGEDDGTTLAYSVAAQPSEGSASILGRTLTFDPGADFQDLNAGETRDVTITVEAQDQQGATVQNDVTVTVTGVNDDPTLGAGILNAAEDGPAVTLDLSTLGDDADGEDDGTTLAYSVAAQPSEGSASILGTTLTFDPGADFQDLNAGETRDVTITVEAQDQQGATVQNDVTVTVTGVNDDPTLGAGILNAAEDGPAVTLDLSTLGDDADGEDDGTTLAYSVAAQPSEGSASILGTTLTFDPGADFQDLGVGETRDVTITVEAQDQQGATVQNDVVVTVAGVNDDPDAQDDTYSLDEDGSLNVLVGTGVLSNDSDVDGDGLTISQLISDVSNGTLNLNADGSFDYTPDADFNGTDSFIYEVSDGNGGTVQATATITVNPVNDDPVANDDAGISTGFETPIVIATGTLLSNDDDGDPEVVQPLAVTGVTAVSGGTVQLAGGNVTFTPMTGFTGAAQFMYTITDGNGGFDTATVTVNVQGSSTPIAQNDDLTTDEDNPLSGSLFADNGNGADSDPNGDPLSVTEVDGDPANVGVPINLDSGAILTVNSDGTFDYDPNGAFEDLAVGSSSAEFFTYTITDGNGGFSTANVTLTVTGVNDAPTVANGVMNAAEDGVPVSLNLSTLGDDIDTDDDGTTLTYGVTTLPGEGTASLNGTNLNFDPGADFQDLNEGETRGVIIGVTATDSHGASSSEGTVTVTVTGVNDDPTLGAGVLNAVEDGAAVTLDLSTLGDDADNEDDGTTLTYTVVGQPSEGSASILGTTLTFNPGADFQDLNAGETRDVTVTVEAEDQRGATVQNDVTVTVTGVNDDPTLAAGVLNAAEDGPAVTLDLATLGDDADGEDDGTTLTYTVAGQPLEGSASILGTTLTFDPGTGFQDLNDGETRNVTITVEAQDQQGATVQNDVTVTVTGVNDAPVLAAIGPISIPENSTAVGTATATDVDDAILTFSISGGADAALFQMASDGTFSFINAPDFEAPGDADTDNVYEVEVQVSDGTLTDSELVFVSVTDVNEGGGPNEIIGTSASDYLVGTDQDDAIRSLGGRYDRMVGDGGADQFIFGEETLNGIRERDVILDYEVGVDEIVFEAGAADVSFIRNFSGGAIIYLDGDRDAIYVRGDNVTADNLTIINDNGPDIL